MQGEQSAALIGWIPLVGAKELHQPGFANWMCRAERIVMWSPDGAEYVLTGVYHEVVAPERLGFTNMRWAQRVLHCWMD